MTPVYFDTSALAKTLVREEGTDEARRLWQHAGDRVMSYLAWPEVHSALASAVRAGRLTDEQRKAAMYLARRRFERCITIGVEKRYLRDAADLVEVFELRAADAIHLATAVAVLPPEAVFATWDRRLHKAAALAELAVAPALL